MKHTRALCSAICIICNTTGLSQTLRRSNTEYPPEELRTYSHWTVFSHPRFGYELPVPPGVRALGIPEMATETRFVSQDGAFEMTAWGGLSPDHPSRIFESLWTRAISQPGRYINYKRKARSWFVVSGVDKEGREFYEKFLMRGDRIATFTLTYPHSRLLDFDSWVSKIEDRFLIVSNPARGPAALAPVPAWSETAPFHPSPRPPGIAAQSQSLARSSQGEVPPKKPAARTTVSKKTKTQVDVTPPPKSTKKQPDDINESTEKDDKPGPPEQKKPEKSDTRNTSAKEDLPYGVPVVGKAGYVYSPYATTRIVDAVDLPRGTKVKCPYTNKTFRIP